MVTKQEFFNAPKRRGLSNAVKEERWKQHVEAVRVSQRQPAPVSAPAYRNGNYVQVRDPRMAQVNSAHDKELENYINFVADPFNVEPAKIPYDTPHEGSGIWVLDTLKTLHTNEKGGAMLMVRDDIRRHYLDSDTTVHDGGTVEVGNTQKAAFFQDTITAPFTDEWQFDTSNAGRNPTQGGPGDDDVPHTKYQPVDKFVAVQDAVAMFRTLALGLQVRYIGAPLEAKGEIVIAVVNDPTTFLPLSQYSQHPKWTFQDLKELKGSKVFPAITGTQVCTFPIGDVYTLFRKARLNIAATASTWDNEVSNSSQTDPTALTAVFSALNRMINVGNGGANQSLFAAPAGSGPADVRFFDPQKFTNSLDTTPNPAWPVIVFGCNGCKESEKLFETTMRYAIETTDKTRTLQVVSNTTQNPFRKNNASDVVGAGHLATLIHEGKGGPQTLSAPPSAKQVNSNHKESILHWAKRTYNHISMPGTTEHKIFNQVKSLGQAVAGIAALI